MAGYDVHWYFSTKRTMSVFIRNKLTLHLALCQSGHRSVGPIVPLCYFGFYLTTLFVYANISIVEELPDLDELKDIFINMCAFFEKKVQILDSLRCVFHLKRRRRIKKNPTICFCARLTGLFLHCNCSLFIVKKQFI